MNDGVAQVLAAFARIKVLPAHMIDAVVAFSGTATPQFPSDLVHQACLEWRSDLAGYLLQSLDAAEVLVDVPTEGKRLIIPGAPKVVSNGQSLPFFFQANLALLPTELERVAPRFAQFIVDVEKTKGRLIARAHLEFAMAVTTWILMRLALDHNLRGSRELIDEVSEDGVDVKWLTRPTVKLEQSLANFSLMVTASMDGELVPKRKITVPLSFARH